MTTSQVPKELSKKNWREDHLNFKHDGTFYTWCPLCMSKQDGEKNVVKNNDLGIDVSDLVKPKSIFGG